MSELTRTGVEQHSTTILSSIQREASTRVVMLVRNSATHDTRVRKEAESLAEAGYSVTVLGLRAPETPDDETVHGVRYVRVDVPRRFVEGARRRYLKRVYAARDRYINRHTALTTVLERASTRFAARQAKRLPWSDQHWLLRLGRRTAYRPVRAVWLAGRRLIRVRRRAAASLHRVNRRAVMGLIALCRLTYRASARRDLALWRASRRVYNRTAFVHHDLDYSPATLSTLDTLKPDILHAHDLNTLLCASRYARRSGSRLIYDAHEYERRRNTTWIRGKRAWFALVERRGARRADAVITVSPEIASALERHYSIDRVRLVLNSPPISTRALSPAYDVKTVLGLDSTARVIAYSGGVGPGRGLGLLISALKLLDEDLHLAVIGPRREDYDAPLRAKADEQGVSERVHLLRPVEPRAVPATLGTTDVSVIPIEPICRSYEYCLPNKLFDAVMAGHPVVVTPLPTMSKVVQEYRLGVVADGFSGNAIAEALREVFDHRARFDKASFVKAQEQFAWEHQARTLLSLYADIMPPGPRRHAVDQGSHGREKDEPLEKRYTRPA